MKTNRNSDHGIWNTRPHTFAFGRARTVAACIGLIAAQSIVAGSVFAGDAPWGLDRINQSNLPLDGDPCFAGDGAGVNIYVVSTGIRHDHVDVAGRANPFYDYNVANQGDDHAGSGTWLASIAGGTTYGVAKAATLHSVRVEPINLTTGLDFIENNGALPGVVLLDAFGGAPNAVIDDAIDRLVNAGFVVVVPAGTGNTDACAFSPQRAPSAITVAATDNTDGRAAWSNYGPCVDLFAPGVNITGAWASSDTATRMQSGTAAAAAHVAGAVAVRLGQNEDPLEVIYDATTNVVTNPGAGSPNRLLYAEPGPCPATCEDALPAMTVVTELVHPGAEGWSVLGYDASALDTHRVYAAFDRPVSVVAVGDAFADDDLFEVDLSGGTFHNDPDMDSSLPPYAGFVGVYPSLQWDTFVTIGEPIGLGSGGAANTRTSPDFAVQANGLVGDFSLDGEGWYVSDFPAHADAVLDGATGSYRVLIAQFTVGQGKTVTGTNWRVSVDACGQDGTTYQIFGDFVADGCPWDFNGNDAVKFEDLTYLMVRWGACEGCIADIDGEGSVGFGDLIELINNWGPCP